MIERTNKSFNKLKELKKEIAETKIREKTTTDDNEWIKESFNQLESLDPKLGEELKLNQTKLFLTNREKIFISIGKISYSLYLFHQQIFSMLTHLYLGYFD